MPVKWGHMPWHVCTGRSLNDRQEGKRDGFCKHADWAYAEAKPKVGRAGRLGKRPCCAAPLIERTWTQQAVARPATALQLSDEEPQQAPHVIWNHISNKKLTVIKAKPGRDWMHPGTPSPLVRCRVLICKNAHLNTETVVLKPG